MARKPLTLANPDDLSQLPSGERLDLGVLNIGPPGPALVVDGPTQSITLPGTHTVYLIAAQNNGNRNVRNIIGGETGDILILARGNGSPAEPRLLEGAGGNLQIDGTFRFRNVSDCIVLYRFGAGWLELSRSSNG